MNDVVYTGVNIYIFLAIPHFLKWLSDHIITLGFVQIVWTGDAHDAGDENMMKYHVVQ